MGWVGLGCVQEKKCVSCVWTLGVAELFIQSNRISTCIAIEMCLNSYKLVVSFPLNLIFAPEMDLAESFPSLYEFVHNRNVKFCA